MAFPCISANSAYLTWCPMQLIPLRLSGGAKRLTSSPCAPLAYSFFFPTKHDHYKSFSNGSPSTAPPQPPHLYLATMATLYFDYIITRSQFFFRFIVFVGDYMVVLLCLSFVIYFLFQVCTLCVY